MTQAGYSLDDLPDGVLRRVVRRLTPDGVAYLRSWAEQLRANGQVGTAEKVDAILVGALRAPTIR